MFVVVSIFTDKEEDKTVIHTYGPRRTKTEAELLEREIHKTDIELYGERSPYLFTTVCKVLGVDSEDQ